MQLTNLTIREAHQLLISKKLSSVELTQAMLDRIHNLDKKVKSYVTKWVELRPRKTKREGRYFGGIIATIEN